MIGSLSGWLEQAILATGLNLQKRRSFEHLAKEGRTQLVAL